MSGVKFHIPSGEVALVGGAAKTVIEVTAPANHRVLIKGIEVSFKGTSTTDTPVKVDIARITTTGTGSPGITVKNSPGDDETVQTIFEFASTVEPTYTTNGIMKTWEIHPQTGVILFFPLGEEVIVPGSGLIGVRCNAVQNQTVSVNLYCDE